MVKKKDVASLDFDTFSIHRQLLLACMGTQRPAYRFL
jgi:hypothetical protein